MEQTTQAITDCVGSLLAYRLTKQRCYNKAGCREGGNGCAAWSSAEWSCSCAVVGVMCEVQCVHIPLWFCSKGIYVPSTVSLVCYNTQKKTYPAIKA